MHNRRFWGGLVILVASVAAAYLLVIRPWHMHWGATPQEVAMSLPGDPYIVPDAAISTRAVTINAPASAVWAWLVQTGQNRGGAWYTYEWLENLFAAEMRPIERIDPQLQELQVGDEMYFHAGGATNAAMVATVLGLQPERALWLTGGWSFVLQPLDANTTRLLVRYPMKPDALLNPILSYTIFEPAHFVMESGMMLGIKAHAERAPQHTMGGN